MKKSELMKRIEEMQEEIYELKEKVSRLEYVTANYSQCDTVVRYTLPRPHYLLIKK